MSARVSERIDGAAMVAACMARQQGDPPSVKLHEEGLLRGGDESAVSGAGELLAASDQGIEGAEPV